jgi:hypothetical protein
MRSEARDVTIHKVLETGTLEMVCVDFIQEDGPARSNYLRYSPQ